MISVEIKEHESVDRALKRFKKRLEKAGVIQQTRTRTAYIKPSIKRRSLRLRTLYRQRLINEELI